MNNIMLTSHGKFAKGLKSMGEMVLGELNIDILSFEEGMGIEIFKKNVNLLFEKYDFTQDYCVILCDLKNGTPYNVCLQYILENGLHDKVKILYGMNFPMLLTIIDWQEGNIDFKDLWSSVKDTQKKYLIINN